MQRTSIRHAAVHIAFKEEKPDLDKHAVWEAEVGWTETYSLGSLFDHKHYSLVASHLFYKKLVAADVVVTVSRGRLGNDKVCELKTDHLTVRCLGTREPLFFERRN